MEIRPEEKRCAEKLVKWLEALGFQSSWGEVEGERPDFTVTVQRSLEVPEKWGVEVTGLFQYVEWNGDIINIRNIQAPLEGLCKRLTKYAQELQNGLTYSLFVRGPYRAKLSDLEERARDYIKGGVTNQRILDDVETRRLFGDGLNDPPDLPGIDGMIANMIEAHAQVFISGQPGMPEVTLTNMLEGVARVPGTDTMAADIMASLTYGVQRLLDEKLPIMKKVTEYDRKMILVWSDYFFAKLDRVSEIISRAALTNEDIDSIVLIEPTGVIGCVSDPAGMFRETQRSGS